MLTSARAGFCERTGPDPGSCAAGDRGSWAARANQIETLADCAVRCLGCPRCEFVSFSAPLDDCS
eukprot:5221212-Prymnesium_polylepis.1